MIFICKKYIMIMEKLSWRLLDSNVYFPSQYTPDILTFDRLSSHSTFCSLDEFNPFSLQNLPFITSFISLKKIN